MSYITNADTGCGLIKYGSALVPFFNWNDEYVQDGASDHVGIVEKVEGGVVYTVEGNSSDMCQENRYYEILGYGTPAY